MQQAHGDKAGNKRARNSGQIVARVANGQSRFGKQRADRRLLAGAQFHNQPAARRKQARRVGSDGTVGIEAIVAAIERKRRIVVAHLRREGRDFAAHHIRRVRHDDIEWAAHAGGDIAGDESAAIGETEARGIAAARCPAPPD